MRPLQSNRWKTPSLVSYTLPAPIARVLPVRLSLRRPAKKFRMLKFPYQRIETNPKYYNSNVCTVLVQQPASFEARPLLCDLRRRALAVPFGQRSHAEVTK